MHIKVVFNLETCFTPLVTVFCKVSLLGLVLMRIVVAIPHLAFHSIDLSVGAVELGNPLVCTQLEMQ